MLSLLGRDGVTSLLGTSPPAVSQLAAAAFEASPLLRLPQASSSDDTINGPFDNPKGWPVRSDEPSFEGSPLPANEAERLAALRALHFSRVRMLLTTACAPGPLPAQLLLLHTHLNCNYSLMLRIRLTTWQQFACGKLCWCMGTCCRQSWLRATAAFFANATLIHLYRNIRPRKSVSMTSPSCAAPSSNSS